MNSPTSENVDEARGVGVSRQEKASGLDDIPAGSDTGALELIIIEVPELGHPGFSLDTVLWFLGIQVVELAITLPPLPALLPLLPISKGFLLAFTHDRKGSDFLAATHSLPVQIRDAHSRLKMNGKQFSYCSRKSLGDLVISPPRPPPPPPPPPPLAQPLLISPSLIPPSITTTSLTPSPIFLYQYHNMDEIGIRSFVRDT